jgi:sterol desaturase/sphingolipid hydroxylase (fatty acid hydroxylase superfamily)
MFIDFLVVMFAFFGTATAVHAWAEVGDKKKKDKLMGAVDKLHFLQSNMLGNVFTNLFVVIPLTYLVFTSIFGLPWSATASSFSLLSIPKCGGVVMLQYVLFEFVHWFFHSNRWLHDNVHSIHHSVRLTEPLTAFYCHVIEMVFANILPVVFPSFLLGLSYLEWLVWLFFAVSYAALAHSSRYNIGSITREHGRHHLRY